MNEFNIGELLPNTKWIIDMDGHTEHHPKTREMFRCVLDEDGIWWKLKFRGVK